MAAVDDKENFSRDTLLALPGMLCRVETQPKGVELTLWGQFAEADKFSGWQAPLSCTTAGYRSILDFTLHRRPRDRRQSQGERLGPRLGSHRRAAFR